MVFRSKKPIIQCVQENLFEKYVPKPELELGYDFDTEFLSPDGWKKFVMWKSGDKVAQFNKRTRVASFVDVEDLIRTPCDEFVSIKARLGVDMVVAKDQPLLVYKKKENHWSSEKMPAEDLKKINDSRANGFNKKFLSSFKIDTGSIPMEYSDNMLKLHVAVSADANLSKTRVILEFRRERKILRCKQLLESCNISGEDLYEAVDSRGDHCFRFSRNYVNFKGVQKFWKADKRQLEIISNECVHWDGDQRNIFYTPLRAEADFMHYAFSSNGKYRATISTGFNEKGEESFLVRRTKNIYIGISGSKSDSNVDTKRSMDGYSYNFEVPAGCLVTRRNASITIGYGF